MLGSLNWAMVEASLKKFNWSLADAPSFNLFTAISITLLLGRTISPLQTSANSPEIESTTKYMVCNVAQATKKEKYYGITIRNYE